ncbi:MAG TPA: homoserine kinase [Gaiellales bacterium]|nr:homoserine kinase [Gaiellales bacterium]
MPDLLVTAPASSANLGPGFDCMAVALELRNEVELSLGGAPGVRVEIEGEGAGEAPADEHNLFVRAFAAAGGRVDGLDVSMRNRVPFARGLGSSAAAICAGVASARAMAGADPAGALAEAAALEGHPDNAAAALLGGVTLAWTAGDGPRSLRLPSCPVEFVAVIPPSTLATDVARAALPQSVSHREAAHTAARAALLVAALALGRTDLIADALDDRLHEPYRAPLVPLLAATRLAAAGRALGVTLSGAGPAVLVWCEPGSSAATAAVLDGLDGASALALAVADRGVTVERTHAS